jgi:transcriptional regulator with XRE-family HTH domain
MNTLLGKNLKVWRDKLGFSQEKIAEYLGISRENISYYENGEREIPVKYLEKISELFGIEPDLLFEEDISAQEAEMAFAFRNDETLSVESLESIAKFKKIVRNYLMMESKL